MPDPILSYAKKFKDLALNLFGATDGKISGYSAVVGEFSATDKCLVFYDTGGLPPIPNLLVDYPSVQVIGRGDTSATAYPDTYNVLAVLKNKMLGIDGQPASFPELTSCTIRGDITHMGKDANGRQMFSLNFQLIAEPVASADGHRMSL